jgi:FdhD protein
MMEPARIVDRQIWRHSGLASGGRSIPEETAVALTYNGGSYAVMMTTPQDLKDFAVGFSLSEGIISSPTDIDTLDVVHLDDGIELRMWLSKPKADRLRERRRYIAGPTGCGLCGIETVAQAMRPPAVVGTGRQFSSEQIMTAMRNISSRQKLNIETRAVHAAAFWHVDGGIVALREDVGRHNALDKLAGAGVHRGGRGDHTSHQPGVDRNGAEKRYYRRAGHGVGFGADGTRRSHGGCRGYHTCRHRPRRRIRGVHASSPNSVYGG